jgi:hypothetical protein
MSERFLATRVGTVLVSTIYRESSAAVNSPPWYFETMAFDDDAPGIEWQSSAGFKREALRQHALAVRWFARRLNPAAVRAASSGTGETTDG